MPEISLLTKAVWACAAILVLLLVWLVVKSVFPFAIGVAVGAGVVWYMIRD